MFNYFYMTIEVLNSINNDNSVINFNQNNQNNLPIDDVKFAKFQITFNKGAS